MWTEQKITDRCKEVCARAGHDFTIPVKINSRLRSTLGRCRYKWDNPVKKTIIPTVIEFSKQFLETSTDESIDEVIKHECCHYLVAIETKQRHMHDACFKAMCKRVGTTNDRPHYEELKRTVDPSNIYKYTVCCENGDYETHYQRRGKVISNIDFYSCPICGGHLKVIQNR